LERFDFSESGAADRLVNFIQSFSMFAEKKLTVVENLFEAMKPEQEKLLAYLQKGEIQKSQESFLVVFQELIGNEDNRKGAKYVLGDNQELFRQLTGQGIQQEEFDRLAGAKLETWAKNEAARHGVVVEATAIKKLTFFTGPDLWRLANEIQKLVAFKDRGVISEKDIEELVKPRLENDIFRTIDSLAAGRKKIALELLHRHLAEGESEIYLLTMLVYQFRNLLLVKSQIEKGVPFFDLSKKIKMHPFVMRKSFEQTKGFSFSALKKIYERLLTIDREIKSGRLEATVALDLITCEIGG
jgi:DNA polymerase-3 subunit delta